MGVDQTNGGGDSSGTPSKTEGDSTEGDLSRRALSVADTCRSFSLIVMVPRELLRREAIGTICETLLSRSV